MCLQAVEHARQSFKRSVTIGNHLMLALHLLICSHLFETFYLVLTIVQRLQQVFTSCGTPPLNYHRSQPVWSTTNTCTPPFHLFAPISNIPHIPDHGTSTGTGVYKLRTCSSKYYRGLPLSSPPTLVCHLPICSHLFATSYIAIKIVRMVLKVFTSCRTQPLNYYRGLPT